MCLCSTPSLSSTFWFRLPLALNFPGVMTRTRKLMHDAAFHGKRHRSLRRQVWPARCRGYTPRSNELVKSDMGQHGAGGARMIGV